MAERARGLIPLPGAMGLDWLTRPKGQADVRVLVSRKQYDQAIEALRATFAKKLPDANQRLQLAALLVVARRGGEAVPLLLGLAHENVRRGFPDRALEMLDRIETIQPGRADVEQRRESLQAELAARAEWVEPVVLNEDKPFASSQSDEVEPVSLASLEESLPEDEPEDEPVLADPDVSDPSTWAGAIVDAAFGTTEEDVTALRSLEESDTNPFGYRSAEVQADREAQKAVETSPKPSTKVR
jgi:hypothetical protein